MTIATTLAEVVARSTGTRNPAAQPNEEFKYVDVAAVDNVRKIICGARGVLGIDAPSRARKVIRTGDVLVSTVRPNLNAVAMVPSELDDQIASTGFCVLRPTQRVLPEYLFAFVRSKGFVEALTRLVAGAMYPAVTDAQVLAQSISVPDLTEQRRVVDLLSRAEGIVRLRREAQAKAAEFIPALFVDVFGDPSANPKGFDRLKLAAIAEVVSGITKGRKLNGRTARPVPYLRVANVQAGFLDITELKLIDATESEIRALALQPGDIVLTEGGDFDKLGRGAQWREQIPDCIHQNHVFRVRLNRDMAEPDYFEAFLQTAAAKSYFLSVAKRTTNLASINMTQLRNLPVLLPPIELQRIFSRRAAETRSIVGLQNSALAYSESTFHALLARYFADRGGS